MTGSKNSLLRKSGFGFLGAIAASLSHEINNVFAIINELSGLLDDYFFAAQKGAPLDLEKLRGTTKRISAQVVRGQKYVNRLNRFAHIEDKPKTTTDLNETMEAAVTLCRRFGTLRRVEIETSFLKTSTQIRCSAFDLQHMVYRCIDILLKASKQGDIIHISAEARDNVVNIAFSNTSEMEDELGPELDFLGVLVAQMNGEIESTIQCGHCVRIVVSIPDV